MKLRSAEQDAPRHAVSRRTFLGGGALSLGQVLVSTLPSHASPTRLLDTGNGGQIDPASLRCEFLRNPLGLQSRAPRLTWLATPEQPAPSGYEIEVASREGGPPDLWQTGPLQASETSVLYGGKPLAAHQQAFWRIRPSTGAGTWSPWQRWSVGPLQESDWGGSHWIGQDDLLEDTQNKMPGTPGPVPEPDFFPAPHLRHEFSVASNLRYAMLYACAPGFAELRLNGRKVGSAVREPGFTNFDRRLLYVTHDITEFLQAGTNAIGAILGTGWYDVHDVATWHMNTATWRKRPRLLLTIVLHYEDGRHEFICSDSTWKASYGPLLRDGIYTGDVYDARKELPGWDRPSYDGSAWKPVLLVDPPHGELTPLPCEPVRITGTFTPVAVTRPAPGVFIVDMGQNFSGHTQLHIKTGAAGQAITMRYAELLNPDGTLNSRPIDHFMEQTVPRQPFQQDTYICKGSGESEVWEQRFSWSGFRYVEVTGFPGTPTVDNFRGRFAHTDMEQTGDFHCSDQVANLVQAATLRSFLSNSQSYPTDCPQREKNGWTGDAGNAVQAGLVNFRSAAFYLKWLDDLADAQRPDGGLPVVVPNGGWGDGEGWPGALCPPWDAAYPIIAWEVYRNTGDRRVLEQHLARLRHYLDFFLAHRKGGGLAPALGLGDWSPYKAVTDLAFITNAYLYLDVVLLQKMYAALGDANEAAALQQLASHLGSQIHEAFYDPATHRYANGTQCAQGMALWFGFVPQSEQPTVLADLVSQLKTLGHLDVGFLGAKFVTRSLAAGGHAGLAYKMAMRSECPGYGFWVETNHSTTLWEGWEAGPSYNHIMFGDISAWLYEWIAGIQQVPGSIAYKRILFQPQPVSALSQASARILTPYGYVSSSWTREANRMSCTLTVPPGCVARFVAPAGARIRSGEPNTMRSGVHQLDLELNGDSHG